jgi:hypothetical protein
MSKTKGTTLLNSKFKPKIKWSKKLYLKTGYPDNYIDESFLNKKKTNGWFSLKYQKFDLL